MFNMRHSQRQKKKSKETPSYFIREANHDTGTTSNNCQPIQKVVSKAVNTHRSHIGVKLSLGSVHRHLLHKAGEEGWADDPGYGDMVPFAAVYSHATENLSDKVLVGCIFPHISTNGIYFARIDGDCSELKPEIKVEIHDSKMLSIMTGLSYKVRDRDALIHKLKMKIKSDMILLLREACPWWTENDREMMSDNRAITIDQFINYTTELYVSWWEDEYLTIAHHATSIPMGEALCIAVDNLFIVQNMLRSDIRAALANPVYKELIHSTHLSTFTMQSPAEDICIVSKMPKVSTSASIDKKKE